MIPLAVFGRVWHNYVEVSRTACGKKAVDFLMA